ncbi:hypothetical protein BPIT_07600 [Candidatus Brocadia pituitae]|nr:hypothetical protein BPIT_07600 [Candidatus Brocadia pituitae]
MQKESGHCEHIRFAKCKLREAIQTIEIASGYRPRKGNVVLIYYVYYNSLRAQRSLR